MPANLKKHVGWLQSLHTPSKGRRGRLTGRILRPAPYSIWTRDSFMLTEPTRAAIQLFEEALYRLDHSSVFTSTGSNIVPPSPGSGI
jgi:hypothetical protein